jgi:hypothetical protein
MKPIKSVDYVYDSMNNIKEAIVTYLDGTRKVAKTSYELNEIQQTIANQQRQVLIEKTPSGKPV